MDTVGWIEVAILLTDIKDTHREKLVLYLIQYKNLLKYKVASDVFHMFTQLIKFF